MMKEWVISIIIVIAIVIGDIFTMKYTNQSVDEATTALAKMREEIAREDEEINSEQVKTQIGILEIIGIKDIKNLQYI